MKKTNILVEVSDDVYSLVVEPFKKNKTFSKLIASLLQGYIEKDFIRAYADGTLEDMHKASVDALDESIQGLYSSLSTLGVYTEGLKSNMQQGIDEFEGYSAGKELAKPVESNEDLRESVDEVKAQNERILEMLNMLVSNGVEVPREVVVPKVEVPKPEAHKASIKVEEKVEHPIPVSDDSTFEIEEEPNYEEDWGDEEDEAPTISATDALASLLDGSNFSF